MPELPEVETVCRGLEPALAGRRIAAVRLNRPDLRFPFPSGLAEALAGAEVSHRWAWIQDHSCDGLPLVGPLPGDPRLVACTGFNGNLTGLPVRAARAVVDGLLAGRSAGAPRLLSPTRMV